MAIKIYIDQGHNPQNPNAGAEGNGYREQDLVYTVGQELASILRAEGYDVRLSRPTADTQLGTSNATSLAARVNEANAWGADYFISLHTNASVIPEASGSEALVYRLGSAAARLGEDILQGLQASTGLANRGVVARPELYVLRRTRMPAVLVELGFITNPQDAALLANEPQRFAEGVADGINAYLSMPAVATPDDGDARSVQQQEELPISYAEFLAKNPYSGRLKIQAYRGDQAFPVPQVQVYITRQFTDGQRVFFQGMTDENGIIDNIVLPAPSRVDSLTPSGPITTAVYDLRAEHPDYQTVQTQLEIFEGITAIQPLRLLLKED